MVSQTLLLLLVLVGCAMSQYVPSYAPRGWPPVPSSSDDDLSNRVGDAARESQSPDDALASRVAAWPADRQPFWFINRNQIQQHIGQESQSSQNSRPLQSRTGSFARQ